MSAEISKFIRDQLSVWPLAASNFRALKKASVKEFSLGGITVKAQFNPCRIASTTAETDPDSIAARPCFLCADNRPPEQFHLPFEGRKSRHYNIQVNPYPIFPNHLVIVRSKHIAQTIWHHFPDMLEFVRQNPEFTAFYNGPDSGASAPDHLHFQACPRHMLPLEEAADAFLQDPGEPIAKARDAMLYHFPGFKPGIYVLRAATQKSMAKLFYRLLECCPRIEGDSEPRFNQFSWCVDGEFRTLVTLRSHIRSHHYYSDGPDHLTMSPGAADMAGMFVAPRQEDFDKLTPELLSEMLDEVCISPEDDKMVLWRLTRTQRFIEVGIMSGQTIEFEIISDGAGPQKVSLMDGKINYNGVLYDELYFESVTRSTLFAEATFILYGVTIGKQFHWQRQMAQSFAGSLKFIVDGDAITAINTIGIEDYLLSVISSEMKATAPLELLKAHAVISRSWVMSNLGTHGLYDVCADDHCQRYQGLGMAVGENVRRAIDETWGELLKYDGELCDTRYSKCCGGLTELFSSCWEDRDYPYLQSVEDPYCDCEDSEVLSTVLNDYDLESRDFHDWEVRYPASELSSLIRSKGEDVGEVQELIPLQRGASGRITSLKVKGSKGEITVGKELAIRRLLSTTHLKSSWFDVSREGDVFVLKGHGWGHGVGLCQIGAAVMASKGFGYKEILSYYYKGAQVL